MKKANRCKKKYSPPFRYFLYIPQSVPLLGAITFLSLKDVGNYIAIIALWDVYEWRSLPCFGHGSRR